MLIKTKFEGYSPSGERVLPVFNYSTTAPESWVTDIAKDIAGRATTLTDINTNPFQRFPGERVAPFSELQEQAFGTAGELTPSALTGQAGQLAGAATMGALGTGYDPYRMGEFTPVRAAQYMNPFVEMAMYPQLREAQRASEIQQQVDQAQAVRSGAFGGDRQAIVEAERQRNLGQQLGDIRARGYMSAFDQAQQQFAREQQLREQSRQYGAGLGLQGLQTALQGAGQMGALGGQQFGQARDVVGLQFGLGKEQQQLGQRQRDIEYQNFLNEERYPYQQLEFMSNIMRGTPMGTVQTMYTPPPSTMGQLAGLGIGLGGLASFGRMFKEGGEVQEYAGGGKVTSDYFVDDALEKLSDSQLQQARIAALNSRDQRRLEMIEDELAERASVRAGLGGAFNALPEEAQENIFSAANGGIVAFAGPTEDNNYSLVEDPQFSSGIGAGAMEADRARVEALQARRAAEEDRQRMEFLRTAAPEIYERRMAERPKPAAAPRAAPRAAPSAAPSAAPRETPAPRAVARQAVTRDATTEAVRTLAEANRVAIPEDKTEEMADSLFKKLMTRPNAEQAEFKSELEAAKNRAKEIQARGISEALMKFGFGMAAAASKPGRSQGLAGVIESAAAASPMLAESLAENSKLKQAAEDNYTKLRMDNARYQTAVEQGNMQLASSLANNISQRKMAQADLQNKIFQSDRLFELEKKKLAVQQSQVGQPTAIQKIANDLQAADKTLDRKSALAEASRLAGYSFRTEGAAGGKLAAELRKIDEDFSTLKFLDPNSQMAKNLSAQRQQRISEAYRLFGTEQPGGAERSPDKVLRFDAKGNPIQ